MSTGVEYEREDKAVRVRIILSERSVVRGSCAVPPSDSRLSETPTDSTAWCVTAVGLGAVVLGRGGRRFGYGSDTLEPWLSSCRAVEAPSSRCRGAVKALPVEPVE